MALKDAGQASSHPGLNQILCGRGGAGSRLAVEEIFASPVEIQTSGKMARSVLKFGANVSEEVITY